MNERWDFFKWHLIGVNKGFFFFFIIGQDMYTPFLFVSSI